MHFSTIVSAGLLAIAPVVSASTASVSNKCSFPICVYQIAPGTGAIQSTAKLAPGKSKAYGYPASGAPGYKLSVSPNCQSSNVASLAYAVGYANQVYYNAAGNSNPFTTGGFTIQGSSSACPVIDNKPGSTAMYNAVKACDQSNSLTFVACVS